MLTSTSVCWWGVLLCWTCQHGFSWLPGVSEISLSNVTFRLFMCNAGLFVSDYVWLTFKRTVNGTGCWWYLGGGAPFKMCARWICRSRCTSELLNTCKNMLRCVLFCLHFAVRWNVQHGSRLETWWSDLCQDEGLSTLACKSESGPEW